MTNVVDLIVIGTGPAASTVARKANREGKRVAIVEAREFGGTCALRGCNPKKVYTNAANLVDQARRANGKLARFEQVQINWEELLAFKREFTAPIPEKSEASFANSGIAAYHGAATFVGAQAVQVGTQRLQAERILIGSGARPRPLKIPGEHYVTLSDEFLELEELPSRIAFIGGGYVSMEFAHVAARYGSQATILHRGGRVLKKFDPDLVNQLTEWSQENGIDIVTNADVQAVEKNAKQEYAVTFEKAGRQQNIVADLVIHGAGRQPNLDGMNLEAAGVAYDHTGIKVDEYQRSITNSAVYAAGDCASGNAPQLTPTANEEARVVAKNIFAETPEMKPQYGPIARVAFTAPCLAAVGMSEEAARENGYDLEVRHEVTSQWGTVRKTTQECAAYKVLIDKQTDRILGAHLLGPCAEETIGLFTLAIKYDLTATQLKSTLFAFPTFAADIRNMV